jgi:membrane associated rhomboid family serine protease
MADWNSEKIRAFTSTEIWLMIFARLLVGFGTGVLVDHFYPKVAYALAVSAILLGIVLGLSIKAKGKHRFLKRNA